jgi:DNA repair exonuclease SbcCD ATPase subunit
MIRASAIRPLAAMGLLLLAACAPTRDPNQAGFFSGIANMVTGAYETDTAALQSKAEASEQRVAALQAENDRLAKEANTLDTQERALRARQQKLNQSLIADEKQLQDLRTRKGADQAELDRLTARLKDLEAEHQRLSAEQVSPAELQSLEQQNQQLKQALDQMLKSLPS